MTLTQVGIAGNGVSTVLNGFVAAAALTDQNWEKVAFHGSLALLTLIGLHICISVFLDERGE